VPQSAGTGAHLVRGGAPATRAQGDQPSIGRLLSARRAFRRHWWTTSRQQRRSRDVWLCPHRRGSAILARWRPWSRNCRTRSLTPCKTLFPTTTLNRSGASMCSRAGVGRTSSPSTPESGVAMPAPCSPRTFMLPWVGSWLGAGTLSGSSGQSDVIGAPSAGPQFARTSPRLLRPGDDGIPDARSPRGRPIPALRPRFGGVASSAQSGRHDVIGHAELVAGPPPRRRFRRRVYSSTSMSPRARRSSRIRRASELAPVGGCDPESPWA
jgi:hypothetical protein